MASLLAMREQRCLISRFDRAQRTWRFDFLSDGLAGNKEIGHDAIVDIQIALVLAEVAYVVALGQHSPDSGAKIQRLWQ
ncbi:hypothetical protein [Bordetella ansorpii]|uniref:hypothetical protein n=1 Tax=Bordetella ansorpii TaxID=288768 RepID=UPI0012E8C6AA|nr:hypothetical protein [Bordetella ansorpii]